MKTKLLWFGLAVLVLTTAARALEPFTIGDIKIQGLQRVTAGAVFVALPVRVGDEMNDEVSATAIQSLYATGLFDDVQLGREDDTLIVSVVERPTIASIEIEGNKKIKDEPIEEALKTGSMAAGDIYNPDLVDSFIAEMKQAYVEVGHFNVDISVAVIPIERNRVDLVFTVFEGKVALIKEIRFIGTENVSEADLLDVMELTTKKSLGFLNRNNRYNRAKLRADLEAIANHYHDQGYINITLVSSRVFIADDREGILIVITLSEGAQYRFGSSEITASEDVVDQAELDQLIEVMPGDLYSFNRVSDTRNRITNEFADEGYARAQVDPLPTINDEEQTIDVNYVVKPGKLTYVRRITITGNVSTEDEVIRREMRIYEGGRYSSEQIQQSRARLGRLGLFTSVDIQIVDVPEADDQVDLIVQIEESLTGTLLFGVGYSDSEKASFNFSIRQRNLYGTGKELSLSADLGKVTNSFLLDYTNPYYTLDGVARGFSIDHSESDTSETASTSIYQLDRTQFGVNYRFPISEVSNIGVSIAASQYKMVSVAPADTEELEPTTSTDFRIYDFRRFHPKGNAGIGTVSYRRDTRNRAIFATSGSNLGLAVRTSAGDQDFVTVSGSYAHFFPIGNDMTLRLSSRVDYGSSGLPFYHNYFMSGSASLRGFDSITLGPREICRKFKAATDDTAEEITYEECAASRAIGGDLRFLGRAELFLPFFGTRDSEDKRFSLFVDAGNTFMMSDKHYGKAYTSTRTIMKDGMAAVERQQTRADFPGHEKFSFSNLRAAAGAGFEWLSPIGPFGISYAVPIKEKPGDRTDKFQITLGYLQGE
ncbi:MAG: outer membrane protein assembly factor BamA [Acidiferrobacterales bacterium]|nr:outer membrane protein assembly factor BamA [Acidiferrobacterales bacterium]